MSKTWNELEAVLCKRERKTALRSLNQTQNPNRKDIALPSRS